MFAAFREAIYAINGVTKGLARIGDLMEADRELEVPGEVLRARVEELELSRSVWEAEVEGSMLKAENRFKASMASEARARTLARQDEDLFEDSPPPIKAQPEPEGLPAVLSEDAGGSEDNGLQTMYRYVERGSKGDAEDIKWGY